MPAYYTQNGRYIKHPEAYAKTGAPMFKGKYGKKDMNQITYIYKLNLENGKKYIGKTMDVERRMEQHFNGCGAKVTKKFKPIDYEILDSCPGVLSDKLEQQYTDEYIEKYGYERVRGGNLVNSRDLRRVNDYTDSDSSFSSMSDGSDE